MYVTCEPTVVPQVSPCLMKWQSCKYYAKRHQSRQTFLQTYCIIVKSVFVLVRKMWCAWIHIILKPFLRCFLTRNKIVTIIIKRLFDYLVMSVNVIIIIVILLKLCSIEFDLFCFNHGLQSGHQAYNISRSSSFLDRPIPRKV